jgi:hypothetical protein
MFCIKNYCTFVAMLVFTSRGVKGSRHMLNPAAMSGFPILKLIYFCFIIAEKIISFKNFFSFFYVLY